MKATTLLKEDHRNILRALDVLEMMTAHVKNGGSLNERDALDLVAFLQKFADRHHQGKEEFILFPALLRDRYQKNYGQMCHFIFEHNQERSLADGLEEAIRTKNTKDFIFCAYQLVEKLRSHIEKENRTLFELVDATLLPADDEQVTLEMQNFESLWKQRVLPTLFDRLNEMEQSYVGSAHARPVASD